MSINESKMDKRIDLLYHRTGKPVSQSGAQHMFPYLDRNGSVVGHIMHDSFDGEYQMGETESQWRHRLTELSVVGVVTTQIEMVQRIWMILAFLAIQG